VILSTYRIVRHAVLPHESNVFGCFEYGNVTSLVAFPFDEAEVHRLFYDARVVKEAESYPIDSVSEWR
jgi:hypothetical protein